MPLASAELAKTFYREYSAARIGGTQDGDASEAQAPALEEGGAVRCPSVVQALDAAYVQTQQAMSLSLPESKVACMPPPAPATRDA